MCIFPVEHDLRCHPRLYTLLTHLEPARGDVVTLLEPLQVVSKWNSTYFFPIPFSYSYLNGILTKLISIWLISSRNILIDHFQTDKFGITLLHQLSSVKVISLYIFPFYFFLFKDVIWKAFIARTIVIALRLLNVTRMHWLSDQPKTT